MTFEEISVNDKLGRTVVIRSARPEDAEALVEYMKTTSAETPYLIREPEEITITKDDEVNFIEGKMAGKRELMLVATIDGKHVGNCSFTGIAPFNRFKHRCDVAIALYKEYCGCGIGKAMFETLLGAAKKAGYEQAELEVVAGNKNAIALYEKFGFEKCGTFPDYMKYSDGTYADAYRMIKKL
ncbi:GNAT family N-acetyltransferase [Butyrivibrio sp. LB2008]|uniref:GNAT family N-acetyltransferase n=1 Tax=Butyrivibrio sp. LB2008 TaxID=1408305 RepID=UPI00047DBE74|nr:GNAT family N-acetyltransferase [Butyrivibrio sp. LB2008]